MACIWVGAAKNSRGKPCAPMNVQANRIAHQPPVSMLHHMAFVTKHRDGLVLLGILLVMAVAFLFVTPLDGLVDEPFHLDQIRLFLKHEFRMQQNVTHIPGYHALIALPAAYIGIDSLSGVRFLSLLYGAPSVLVFYSIVQALHPGSASRRTLHYAFFPILFPFFFLLYTDVMGLFWVLCAFLALLHRRWALCGAFTIVSMLTRQNNIVWLGFLWAAMFMTTEPVAELLHAGWKGFSVDALKKLFGRARWPQWLGRLKDSAMFLLGIGGFATFVTWNGGIAIGDRDSHPFPAVHDGNVLFLLFVAFVMFLPLHLANIGRIWTLLKRSPTIVAVCCALLFFVVLRFQNDHEYNQSTFFLRNEMLVWASIDLVHRVLYAVSIIWAALSFAVTNVVKPYKLLLFGMTVLSLLPFWLIEQRYYLIPAALFLALREDEAPKLERLLTLWLVALMVVLFVGIVRLRFFL